jgi:hypothetical protein
MIRHVVIWRMKAGREGELPALLEAIGQLPASVEAIEALSAAPLLNESRHDAVLCVDVADADALESYRSHPAHVPVAELLLDLADEAVVADYEVS